MVAIKFDQVHRPCNFGYHRRYHPYLFLTPETVLPDSDLIRLFKAQIDRENKTGHPVDWTDAKIVVGLRDSVEAILCGRIYSGYWKDDVFQITFFSGKFSNHSEATNSPERRGGMLPVCPNEILPPVIIYWPEDPTRKRTR